MEKIGNENRLGLAVFINGKPDLSVISKGASGGLCLALLSLLEGEAAL